MCSPDLLKELEEFVVKAQTAAVLEAGEAPFALLPGQFRISKQAGGVLLEVWDRERSLARVILRPVKRSSHTLVFEVRRFRGRKGQLILTDLGHARSAVPLQRAARELVRERLRMMAARWFPGWRLSSLTVGADLEHSLSPAFARGWVTSGAQSWAMLATPLDHSDAAETLAFGLIWLDHLRRQTPGLVAPGLAVFVPEAIAQETRLLLSCLNPAWRFRLFSHRGDHEVELDLRDTGNLDTCLGVPPDCTLANMSVLPAWIRQLAGLPDTECVPVASDAWSLRVRGMEFARIVGGEVWHGIGRQTRVKSPTAVERTARQLAQIRCAEGDRTHAWWRRAPESWIESMVRANPKAVDPQLDSGSIYGQVPSLGGGARGVIDLLGVGVDGQLRVLELKATEDPALPLQALQYWWRVARHLERGDFARQGFFPGRALRNVPPMILLVAPALCFHPTTETVLKFLKPGIEVERIGLGVEWQTSLQVVFRLRGANRPEWNARPGESTHEPDFHYQDRARQPEPERNP